MAKINKNSIYLTILKYAGTFVLGLLVVSLFVKGPADSDSPTECSSKLIKTAHSFTDKQTQLSVTDNNEHLNCLRTSGEEFLFRISQTPKTFCSLVHLFSIVLEKDQCHGLIKTSQELGLSYEFMRMNILASKAHPPTLFL